MRLDQLKAGDNFTKVESGRTGEVIRVGDMGVMIRWHGLETVERQKWDEKDGLWLYSTVQVPYQPVMISGGVEVAYLAGYSGTVLAPRKRGRPKGSKNKKPSKRQRGK